MIFGKLDSLSKDKSYLPKALVKGLDYLQQTDFSKVAVGKYEIEGSSIYALVQEYQTAPKAEKKAEAHGKYIDIQYIAQGKEVIGFAPFSPESEVKENLLDQKDAIYYNSVKGEMDLMMSDGMYAIFFPEEIHRPGCNYEAGGQVRKVVVKIAMSLLEA